MGISSSKTQKTPDFNLEKVDQEPSYWRTTFATAYTIKLSENCYSPEKFYANLKKDLIETFDNIHKKYPDFAPLIRFNEPKKSIEIGHAYRDFFHMLLGSKFHGEFPNLVSRKILHGDSSYRTHAYSNEEASFVVFSDKDNEFKEVRSENGDFVAYDADHPEFEKQAKEFQQNITLKKTPIGPLPQSRSELIPILIKTRKENNTPLRLVLGEQHLNLTASGMILDAMPSLGREKITLGLEGFFYETHQRILDEWMHTPQDTPLPFELNYIQDKYEALFVKAKKYGVRLLAIDTEAVLALPNEIESNTTLSVKRAEGMNYVSAKIINYEVGKGGFVALVGSSHAADLTISSQDKIFGLGNLLEDTVSVIVVNAPQLEGRQISSRKVAVATRNKQDNVLKERLEADIIVQEINVEECESSPHQLEDSKELLPETESLLEINLESPSDYYNSSDVDFGRNSFPVNTTENSLPSHEILKGGISTHKTAAIGASMTLLGWLQTIDSIKKRDLTGALVSGGSAALGSAGIAAELLLKNQNTLRQGTRILNQYAAHLSQSPSFLGEQTKAITRTIPVFLTDGTTILIKGATTFGRAMPFIGAIFSTYSVYQDGKSLYHALQTRDFKEGVKASLGIILDSAIGITALIPAVGTPVSLVLLAARLTSDCIIDQVWDPDSYKKSWAVLHDPSATTLDKVLSAIKTGIQFGWKLNPIVQGVCAWEEAHNLDTLYEKQNSERRLMQFTGANGEDFVKISDILEENVRVLDFTGGSLSPYAGYLTFKIHSCSKAFIHIGKDESILLQGINLGKTPVSTLIVKMGQGAIYDYRFEEEVAKFYFIPVDRKEIATSARVQEKSLISHYWAPEDGTNVTFVAPSHTAVVNKDTVLPHAQLEDYAFYYEIHGGTGINSYMLGQQSAKIFCEKGHNIIHMSFSEDHSRTFILEGFRDDGSCYLNLDDLTAESSLFQNAQIGVRHFEGRSDLVLKIGNTHIELPNTQVKMFTVKTKDSIFYIDSQALRFENVNHANSVTLSYSFKPFQERVGLSIMDTSRDSASSRKIFSGTSGADLFIVDAKKSGNTVIQNFSFLNDKIELKNFEKNTNLFSQIKQKDSDIFIQFDEKNSLTLPGVSLTNITADTFLFTSSA